MFSLCLDLSDRSWDSTELQRDLNCWRGMMIPMVMQPMMARWMGEKEVGILQIWVQSMRSYFFFVCVQYKKMTL